MIRVVILTVALLAGGGAAWLAYVSLSGEPAETSVAEPAEQIPTASVLVAAEQVTRGTRLGPGNLAWQDWPESVVSDRAIRRDAQPDAIESYTGWTARGGFIRGEPIGADRLVEGNGGLMSVILSPGMRAIAIPVSAETGAGGFVLPEDRVDLVHTEVTDADGDGSSEPVSETIIRNVRVLAVDQTAEILEEDGAAKVASTVTLELTPRQVEALSNARNSGRLSVALRSVADFDEVIEDEIVMPEQAAPAVAEIEQPPAEVEEQAESGPARIRIIGSGTTETLEVERREG